jgi:AbrB family looped-hinge helix DNA binding protein
MTVTVSNKYQVVIPEEVRRSTGLRPGQKVELIAYGGHITIVPVPKCSAMRGILKGARIHGYREQKAR